jgi:hypothetical protein
MKYPRPKPATPPTREEYERIAALLNSKLTSAKIAPWEETQYAKKEIEVFTPEEKI